MYIIFLTLFIFAFLLTVIFHFRKKRIIHKICSLAFHEKCGLLNELIEPFGYEYEENQDVFTTRKDAWQRNFGYSTAYDTMAPFFHMVFDCQPVYFEYDGKTWLIEFWKGQYGINTGSEIGVYYADSIIPPDARKRTLFHAVGDDELLKLTTTLHTKESTLASLTKKHWWLTMFSMGHFSKPNQLTLDISIVFPDFDMRDAFLNALISIGYHSSSIYIYRKQIAFTFFSSYTHHFFLKKLYRRYVLWKNHLLCLLYRFVTRPFPYTCDKMLYLYYYLPFAFRRMLRLKRFR